MGIARESCEDESDAVIMASSMEKAGGTVFSVCQSLDGRWHVWARFPSADPDAIKKHYQNSLRSLRKAGVLLTTRRKPQKRAKKK
jgi:hypothetical protein